MHYSPSRSRIIRFVALWLLTGGLSVNTYAAIVAEILVDSPTELTVSLSGEFEGGFPIEFRNELFVSFGTSNYPVVSGMPINPIAFDGTFESSHEFLFFADARLFSTTNTLGDAMDVLYSLGPAGFIEGDTLLGTMTFTYGMPHLIEVGESFDVYWGLPATGTYQSSGFTNNVLTDADFDEDGDVDGADFLAWQRGFGITSGAFLADGDANGDGDVDENDLFSWESQYGTFAPPLFATAILPEPGSLSIIVFCGICVASRCRKFQRCQILQTAMRP